MLSNSSATSTVTSFIRERPIDLFANLEARLKCHERFAAQIGQRHARVARPADARGWQTSTIGSVRQGIAARLSDSSG